MKRSKEQDYKQDLRVIEALCTNIKKMNAFDKGLILGVVEASVRPIHEIGKQRQKERS